MKPDIHLLTGPIRSGKTTHLWDWATGRDDLAGFLSPDHAGSRHFYDLRTRQWLPFEAPTTAPEADVVLIGRFRFWRDSLRRAQGWLQAGLTDPRPWLVIDEIGRLELQGQGLEPMASTVIRHYQEVQGPGRLLLVVRDTLLPAVQAHYDLSNCPLHLGTLAPALLR